MKFSAVLVILFLTAAFNPAFATEEGFDKDSITAYCKEQAELAGIEDKVEKQEYLKDCIDSYSTSGDAQKAD
jgi:hypothetical protein